MEHPPALPGTAGAPVTAGVILMHAAGHARNPWKGGTQSVGIDFAWLAPGRAELAEAGWLDATLRRLRDDLATGALLYVMPPRGWRLRAARQLRQRGWMVGPPTAHLVRRGCERALVPLSRGSLALAADALPGLPGPLPGAARRAARLLARSTALTTALAEAWSVVGFAAWREDGTGRYQWLAEATGAAEPPWDVVSLQGWRGAGDTVLLFYGDARHPDRAGVAKVSRSGDRTRAEADALLGPGATARAAGAVVPELIACRPVGERIATIMTRVYGEPAWQRLGSRRGRVGPLLEQVAGWLEDWNRGTARRGPLTAADLDRLVLEPARWLASELDAPDYLARLGSLCERTAGSDCPWVAAHNDLTMHNILLNGRMMAVLDWESAATKCLPLADLEYAAVDAVAAADGYRDRVAAWERCFQADAAELPLRRLRERLAHALELAPDMATLCHHACWLHHARNEQREGAARRPFLGIVRAMAAASRRGPDA
jgi:hypothetical protein